MQSMTAPELAARMTDGSRSAPLLLDVREPWEYQTCHIDGALSMPMHVIPTRYNELDKNSEIICICHHGARSMNVAMFLEHKGYTNITNLTGGVHAWSQQVDPSLPTY